MRALVFELTSAAWSLGAIGVLVDSPLGEALLEPRTIEELAARCPSIPARRIEKLVAVAAAHGVVVSDGPRHRLADGAAQALCGPMRPGVSGEIRSHLMQPLALALAPGATWSHTDPMLLQAQGDSSRFVPMMIKMHLAPQLGDLAARLERPGAKLLDVGTGVGALAIAACRVFPQVSVVGLDPYDVPLAMAREAVARAGLEARIELRSTPADELRDEATYTLAWLPSFFVSGDVLPRAIARVAASLEPGGWIVMGICGGGDPEQRAINELIVDAWGGPAITTADAERLMRDAGLREIRVMPGPPWSPQLLAATR
ncbi:MAG TPA: class I SAM-dependent methyltransferase [Kofleriaceae bacterium]|nr:class I SAM-dependent methyltransferase [Kofleriaceae bacterium]